MPASLVRQPLLVTADRMRSNVTPLEPADTLEEVMEHFVESDLLALPVVDNLQERRVIGVVKRADLASTYLHRVAGTSGVAGTPAAGPGPGEETV